MKYLLLLVLLPVFAFLPEVEEQPDAVTFMHVTEAYTGSVLLVRMTGLPMPKTQEILYRFDGGAYQEVKPEKSKRADDPSLHLYLSLPKKTGTTTLDIKLPAEVYSSAITLSPPVVLQDAKLSVGYQGWFATPGDGYLDRFHHWFLDKNNVFKPSQDMWPLVTKEEYPDRTSIGILNHRREPIYVYSNAHYSTAETHVGWMNDYNFDAFFVGRFLTSLEASPKMKRFRDRVMDNMVKAVNKNPKEKTKIALFYNVTTNANRSKEDPEDFIDKLWEDGKDVVDHKSWVKSDNYLRVDGKPVLRIYGLGFINRPSGVTAEEGMDMIRRFKDPTHPEYKEKYAAYLIGGVPSRWYVPGGDAFKDDAWREVYESFDVIQPWLVGRYRTVEQTDDWIDKVAKRDMARINELKAEGKRIGYLPLIFPGFSWYNLNGKHYNMAPRLDGAFMKHQSEAYQRIGVPNLMVANFDEVDEGTAIYKVIANQQELPDTLLFPTDVKFLPLDINKTGIQPDHYLQLCKEIAAELHAIDPSDK